MSDYQQISIHHHKYNYELDPDLIFNFDSQVIEYVYTEANRVRETSDSITLKALNSRDDAPELHKIESVLCCKINQDPYLLIICSDDNHNNYMFSHNVKTNTSKAVEYHKPIKGDITHADMTCSPFTVAYVDRLNTIDTKPSFAMVIGTKKDDATLVLLTINPEEDVMQVKLTETFKTTEKNKPDIGHTTAICILTADKADKRMGHSDPQILLGFSQGAILIYRIRAHVYSYKASRIRTPVDLSEFTEFPGYPITQLSCARSYNSLLMNVALAQEKPDEIKYQYRRSYIKVVETRGDFTRRQRAIINPPENIQSHAKILETKLIPSTTTVEDSTVQLSIIFQNGDQTYDLNIWEVSPTKINQALILAMDQQSCINTMAQSDTVKSLKLDSNGYLNHVPQKIADIILEENEDDDARHTATTNSTSHSVIDEATAAPEYSMPEENTTATDQQAEETSATDQDTAAPDEAVVAVEDGKEEAADTLENIIEGLEETEQNQPLVDDSAEPENPVKDSVVAAAEDTAHIERNAKRENGDSADEEPNTKRQKLHDINEETETHSDMLLEKSRALSVEETSILSKKQVSDAAVEEEEEIGQNQHPVDDSAEPENPVKDNVVAAAEDTAHIERNAKRENGDSADEEPNTKRQKLHDINEETETHSDMLLEKSRALSVEETSILSKKQVSDVSVEEEEPVSEVATVVEVEETHITKAKEETQQEQQEQQEQQTVLEVAVLENVVLEELKKDESSAMKDDYVMIDKKDIPQGVPIEGFSTKQPFEGDTTVHLMDENTLIEHVHSVSNIVTEQPEQEQAEKTVQVARTDDHQGDLVMDDKAEEEAGQMRMEKEEEEEEQDTDTACREIDMLDKEDKEEHPDHDQGDDQSGDMMDDYGQDYTDQADDASEMFDQAAFDAFQKEEPNTVVIDSSEDEYQDMDELKEEEEEDQDEQEYETPLHSNHSDTQQDQGLRETSYLDEENDEIYLGDALEKDPIQDKDPLSQDELKEDEEEEYADAQESETPLHSNHSDPQQDQDLRENSYLDEENDEIRFSDALEKDPIQDKDLLSQEGSIKFVSGGELSDLNEYSNSSTPQQQQQPPPSQTANTIDYIPVRAEDLLRLLNTEQDAVSDRTDTDTYGTPASDMDTDTYGTPASDMDTDTSSTPDSDMDDVQPKPVDERVLAIMLKFCFGTTNVDLNTLSQSEVDEMGSYCWDHSNIDLKMFMLRYCSLHQMPDEAFYIAQALVLEYRQSMTRAEVAECIAFIRSTSPIGTLRRHPRVVEGFFNPFSELGRQQMQETIPVKFYKSQNGQAYLNYYTTGRL